MMKFTTVLFSAIMLLACAETEHKSEEGQQKEHRSTEEPHSEETVATGFVEQKEFIHEDGSICKAQSPINILSFTDNTRGMHNITFHFNDKIKAVENLGHTVQLDVSQGSTVTIDGETFDFKQMHFHTPSEHLIDGVTYPMEMHMVHTLQGQKEGEETEYLVIGVLFKMGEQSAFIDEFIGAIPKEAHTKNEVVTGVVKVADLISEKPEDVLDSYYHYMGSLTTPPYTESVRWYVSKHIFEGSPEQIKTILAIEGANARQIQGLNDRELESN